MALITYTLLPSNNKNRKGAKYPRFRINPKNGSKPFFKAYKDIYIYERANTSEKQKVNKDNKKKIELLHKELNEYYKGSEYQNKLSGTSTLDAFLDYMLEIKSHLSKGSNNGYNNVSKMVRDFCNQNGYNINMDINKVNIQFVDEFRTYMVNERKLAGDSAYKYFGLLGTILKTAKKYGKLYHNPYDEKPDFPKKTDKEMEYLTPEEVTKMMKTKCKLPMTGDAFMFMIFTGIRSQDCKALTWRNLPIKSGELYIELKTRKRGIDISFPVPPQAHQYLTKRMGDADLVYPNLKFESYHNNALRMWAYKSGVQKDIHPHMARHSFAAYMLHKGTPLYNLSKLLGHANMRTTSDRYGHLSKEDTDRAIREAFKF